MKTPTDPTITEATITPDPTFANLRIDLGPGGLMQVSARLTDDSVVELFSYYAEELTFSPGEFAGLSVADARELFRQRDVAYLRS